MFDELCTEEAGVNAAIVGNIKLVGLLYPLVLFPVKVFVVLFGIAFQSEPVFFEHHGVVNGAVATCDAKVCCHDVIGLVRQVQCVAYLLLSSLVCEREAILFIDKHRIVSMSYLPRTSTKHQLSVAADGEDEATFIQFPSAAVLPDAEVTPLQIILIQYNFNRSFC